MLYSFRCHTHQIYLRPIFSVMLVILGQHNVRLTQFWPQLQNIHFSNLYWLNFKNYVSFHFVLFSILQQSNTCFGQHQSCWPNGDQNMKVKKIRLSVIFFIFLMSQYLDRTMSYESTKFSLKSVKISCIREFQSKMLPGTVNKWEFPFFKGVSRIFFFSTVTPKASISPRMIIQTM